MAQGLRCSPIRPATCRPRRPPLPVQTNYVGFAGTIQVNPLVQATPSLVRDGTLPPPATAQPSAGYTGIIQDVLNYTFGANQPPGVP